MKKLLLGALLLLSMLTFSQEKFKIINGETVTNFVITDNTFSVDNEIYTIKEIHTSINEMKFVRIFRVIKGGVKSEITVTKYNLFYKSVDIKTFNRK